MAENCGRRALSDLLTPAAVRERAQRLFALAEADALDHWRLVPERLPGAAALAADVTRQSYPDLRVPLHSRWRHFENAGVDHWADLKERAAPSTPGPDAIARMRVELAIVSVLLDAGAGADWQFRDDRSGRIVGRSEGLAIASLRMFENGGFSSDPAHDPLRADADRLSRLAAGDLARHFQVSGRNPLTGLAGRAGLLRAVGRLIASRRDIFGGADPVRLGRLFDHLKGKTPSGRITAADILTTLLTTFNGIWPSGLVVAGVALGDVGRHSALRAEDESDGLIPFHKLTQWLTYSLIEPLAEAGMEVVDIDGLTGLPEYRNGGLMIDAGILVPRDPRIEKAMHRVDGPLVVEWRGLTVALLDRLADLVRAELGKSADEMPLAAVLQGGTWAAGRRLAAERRDGRPPIDIISDGTVF